MLKCKTLLILVLCIKNFSHTPKRKKNKDTTRIEEKKLWFVGFQVVTIETNPSTWQAKLVAPFKPIADHCEKWHQVEVEGVPLCENTINQKSWQQTLK